jgi:hypothetical protein
MSSRKALIDICELPLWAAWIAQDADGTWWAYEHEPNEGAISWYENEVGLSVRVTQENENAEWRKSLRKLD